MLKALFDIYKIMSWHKKIFPEFDSACQKIKIHGEINEFVDEFEIFTQSSPRQSKTQHNKVEEELIDVIIASINAMRYKDIRDKVNQKMKINRQRRWKNGQHKR